MTGSTGSFIWMVFSCHAIIIVYLVTTATTTPQVWDIFPCINYDLWLVSAKKKEHGFTMKLCVSVRVQESLHSNNSQNQNRFSCSKMSDMYFKNISKTTAESNLHRHLLFGPGNSVAVFPYKMMVMWLFSKDEWNQCLSQLGIVLEFLMVKSVTLEERIKAVNQKWRMALSILLLKYQRHLWW